MDYQTLKNALAELNLPEHASLEEIKRHFRHLVKLHHPDTGERADPERMSRINAAHEILLRYCEAYTFSFSEEEFYRQNPEAHLERQFATDPSWGGLNSDKEDH